MWKVYGRMSEAVAIETSVEKLQEAYVASYPGTLAYLSNVEYVNPNISEKIVLPNAVKKIC